MFPVKLELGTHYSHVKHSTIEPLQKGYLSDMCKTIFEHACTAIISEPHIPVQYNLVMSKFILHINYHMELVIKQNITERFFQYVDLVYTLKKIRRKAYCSDQIK